MDSKRSRLGIDQEIDIGFKAHELFADCSYRENYNQNRKLQGCIEVFCMALVSYTRMRAYVVYFEGLDVL